jgi:hypothetical protein
VAYPILRFGTEERIQLAEEVVGRLVVHLLEVGHPLFVHLRFPFRSRDVLTYQPLCCHQAKPSTSLPKAYSSKCVEELFSEVRIQDLAYLNSDSPEDRL